MQLDKQTRIISNITKYNEQLITYIELLDKRLLLIENNQVNFDDMRPHIINPIQQTSNAITEILKQTDS